MKQELSLYISREFGIDAYVKQLFEYKLYLNRNPAAGKSHCAIDQIVLNVKHFWFAILTFHLKGKPSLMWYPNVEL